MNGIYDIILLLSGEETNFNSPYFRNRSKHAIDIFRKGKAGYIFISGGHNFMAKNMFKSEGEYIKCYLRCKGVPEENILLDDRSIDTLGNFSFPEVDPLPKNPKLSDFEKILLVTEKKHMNRALKYANLILQKNIDYSVSQGNRKQGLITKLTYACLYNQIKKLEPHEIHNFLLKKHPFYNKDFFKYSRPKRLAKTVLSYFSW